MQVVCNLLSLTEHYVEYSISRIVLEYHKTVYHFTAVIISIQMIFIGFFTFTRRDKVALILVFSQPKTLKK